jgi:response regulator RpfG family c-di-GMP phosphodiesterase
MSVQRVLCVDDDEQLLSGLERGLRKVCPVVTANGGPAALELLRNDRDFAVIISDMRMPVMDGAHFLAQARLLVPRAIRILLTGQADLDAVIQAVNAGHIHHYMHKPIEREELTQLIGRAFVEQTELVKQAERARTTVKAGLNLALALLGSRSPSAAAHVARSAELAVQLGAAVGLSDLVSVDFVTRAAALSRHLPPGNARALVENLFHEEDGLGGARVAVLEVCDQVPGRLSVMAGVVQAALLASELRTTEISDGELMAVLSQKLDHRLVEAIATLPRAA